MGRQYKNQAGYVKRQNSAGGMSWFKDGASPMQGNTSGSMNAMDDFGGRSGTTAINDPNHFLYDDDYLEARKNFYEDNLPRNRFEGEYGGLGTRDNEMGLNPNNPDERSNMGLAYPTLHHNHPLNTERNPSERKIRRFEKTLTKMYTAEQKKINDKRDENNQFVEDIRRDRNEGLNRRADELWGTNTTSQHQTQTAPQQSSGLGGFFRRLFR